MKVAVTGASGHIGVNLVHRLLNEGADVRALVHRNPAPLAGLGVEVVRGSVLDRDSLARAFSGTDVAFNLAGVISIAGDPAGNVRSVNVQGAENVAHAALESGVRRLVHCSSIHAFDLRGAGPIDESSPRVGDDSPSHTAYERSKAEGERRVRAVLDEGLDAVVVQPTSVIGPHDFEPSRMGRVLIGLRNRSLPGLVAGGFDFVDVRDVAVGMIAASRLGGRGDCYLLSGHRLEIGELAALAGSVTGVSPPRVTVPAGLAKLALPVARVIAAARRSEPLFTRESLRTLQNPPAVNRAKAVTELGYTVRPIEETIRDLYRWFADHGFIEPPDTLPSRATEWGES